MSEALTVHSHFQGVAELAAACDRWDRVIESDLATNDAEHDAALRIIEIARRVCSTRKAVNV